MDTLTSRIIQTSWLGTQFRDENMLGNETEMKNPLRGAVALTGVCLSLFGSEAGK
jgi:hypothetical protein